jgi:hypothetical protein
MGARLLLPGDTIQDLACQGILLILFLTASTCASAYVHITGRVHDALSELSRRLIRQAESVPND